MSFLETSVRWAHGFDEHDDVRVFIIKRDDLRSRMIDVYINGASCSKFLSDLDWLALPQLVITRTMACAREVVDFLVAERAWRDGLEEGRP
ncbi:MAG TPA: hypothetical protein VKQ30_08415 [Ktedonobacterales bacterium]|nr:hypothetical protein [Ktedonobacterales bacterium]